jgi:hypothetical protein
MLGLQRRRCGVAREPSAIPVPGGWSDNADVNADVNAARVILARRIRANRRGTSVAARVVHEPRPVHRLDHRPQPRRGNPPGEMAQPVRVGRGRSLRDPLPGIVD